MALDKKFWPEVLQVFPGENYQVYVYFNDGSVRLLDVSDLIQPGTVFEALTAPEVFRDKLAVINHTVAWDMGGNHDPERCIDLDPFVVYEESPEVADPLAQMITAQAGSE